MPSLAPVPDPDGRREVLEFDWGVRAYAPAQPGDYWRLHWHETGRRRDTTARTRGEAIAKAIELVERLAQGTRTDLARAKGMELVAHYLDPRRRPPRGRPWSPRHREEQEAYCRRFVTPVLGRLDCARLGRADFQRVLDAAPTTSVAAHLRRCLSALVNAGLEEGYLLARQDVLRGVRWHGPDDDLAEEGGRAVAEAEIPTSTAVHALARAAAQLTGEWWRELEVLLVAYSGVRWGEHVALTGDRIDTPLRRITVDRQVAEGRHGLHLGLPKGRKRRITMYPARTPGGVALSELVARRLTEIARDGPVFPSPRGHWARRSGYGRRVFGPAAVTAGWPRNDDGRCLWTFHSLRHVFATWALAQPGARLEDVSRLLGHSSVRITPRTSISPPTATSTTGSTGRRSEGGGGARTGLGSSSDAFPTSCMRGPPTGSRSTHASATIRYQSDREWQGHFGYLPGWLQRRLTCRFLSHGRGSPAIRFSSFEDWLRTTRFQLKLSQQGALVQDAPHVDWKPRPSRLKQRRSQPHRGTAIVDQARSRFAGPVR